MAKPPLNGVAETEYTKSHLRGLFSPVSATPTNALRALVNSPLLKISFRVHELVAGSSAWRVCATRDKSKVCGFAALRGFSYTTRANISHEKAEQIRARIVCTPAESAWRAWGSLCADESKDFRQPSPVGEGGAVYRVNYTIKCNTMKKIGTHNKPVL